MGLHLKEGAYCSLVVKGCPEADRVTSSTMTPVVIGSLAEGVNGHQNSHGGIGNDNNR